MCSDCCMNKDHDDDYQQIFIEEGCVIIILTVITIFLFCFSPVEISITEYFFLLSHLFKKTIMFCPHWAESAVKCLPTNHRWWSACCILDGTDLYVSIFLYPSSWYRVSASHCAEEMIFSCEGDYVSGARVWIALYAPTWLASLAVGGWACANWLRCSSRSHSHSLVEQWHCVVVGRRGVLRDCWRWHDVTYRGSPSGSWVAALACM